ncbi:hypothetical protein V8C35DRAFT_320521 [Trichoderma chlorosporum]
MEHNHMKEAKGSSSSRSWMTRFKTKVKRILPGRSSGNGTVAGSFGNNTPTLPNLSEPPFAGTAPPETADPPISVPAAPDGHNSFVSQDEASDEIGSSNIWLKAYNASASGTKKWIESLPELTTARSIDKTDYTWVKELIPVVQALERKHQDNSLRDYVVPAMKWLTIIGNFSTQFSPAPSGVVWSAMQVFLQLSVSGIEETTAILAYTARVLSILRRGKIYEVVFTKDVTTPEPYEDLENALIVLYAKTLDLLAYASQNLKIGYRQMLEWISSPGHATSLMAELSQCERNLTMAAECCEIARSANLDRKHTELLLSLQQTVDQINDEMLHLFDKMKTKDLLDALDYFSDVKFGEQHQKKVEMRTAGTGMWLLEHSKYKQWEETAESSILWLQGTVGMGKSFLASSVIDQFLINDATSHAPNRKNNHGFAYFYCERGSTDLSNPTSVLRSYVRQLSIVPCYPEFMQKKLIELYQEIRKQGAKLSIKACRDQLFASANLYPRTIIVLDGLDECDPDERGTLIEILAELVSKAQNPVKLFISSRPEQDIKKQLRSSPCIEVDARDNREDIEKFVVERIEKANKWISVSQDLKMEIKDTLCAKSDGMFRWAFLQMEQLSRLREEKNIKDRLGKLPKSLHAAYDEIFRKIEEEGGRETLERAVKWLMCAERPLQTEEILEAVRLTVSNSGIALHRDPRIAEETLLDIGSHLIVKHSKVSWLKFSHASVIEYFEEVHQWSLEQAHLFVAKICLSYILCNNVTTSDSRYFIGKEYGYRSFIHDYATHDLLRHVSALERPELHKVEVSNLLKVFLGVDKPLQQSSQQYQSWVHDLVKSNNDYAITLYPVTNPIFGICAFGFYHVLEGYWDSGVDIFQINDAGLDLLMIAAFYDHLNICEKLIELGLDVNTPSGQPKPVFSALSCAAGEDRIDVLRCLISHGADPNLALDGPSALCVSVECSSSGITEILLEAKADPNHPCGPKCEFAYALDQAAFEGEIEIGKLLLRRGANANANTDIFNGTINFGSTLAAAIYNGNIDFCELLIAHGGDVNTPLKHGKYGSPLAVAAYRGYKEICQLLIQHGAEVNMPLKGGKYGSALAASLDATSPHVDANILLTSPPQEGAFDAIKGSDWGDEMAEILIEGNYLGRDVLVKIGFED